MRLINVVDLDPFMGVVSCKPVVSFGEAHLDDFQYEVLCSICGVGTSIARAFVSAQHQHGLGPACDLTGCIFVVLTELLRTRYQGLRTACVLNIWRWNNVEGTYLISSNKIFAWWARSCESMTQNWLLRLFDKTVDTSPHLSVTFIAELARAW